ncbi:MAG: CapA family protein [Oscillospiraceae bacterium]|jgi:poly-gamma-glutamate capsule biosynthesis protein CapA/YwtB (metallophosphatase superfamily)|nr:CapA family protein [Oscillospiraceae bacterium]
MRDENNRNKEDYQEDASAQEASTVLKKTGAALIKGLREVLLFIVAVLALAFDGIKKAIIKGYRKLPPKYQIFGAAASKSKRRPSISSSAGRTAPPRTQAVRKKSVFGMSEKDYIKLGVIGGGSILAVIALVIIVLSVNKPKIEPVATVEPIKVVETNQATLTFGGSVVLKESILNSSRTQMGDYEIYEGLQYLSEGFSSDMNIVSLLGAVNAPDAKVSAFPKANYPINLIRALSSIHVNGLALAGDHCLDMGFAGVKSTIEACNELSILPFGIYSDINSHDTPQIREINGIKVGFLSYSGVQDDDYINLDDEEKVFTLKHFDPTKPNDASKAILEDAETLRNSGASFIVTLVRWGDYGTTAPSQDTRTLADNLACGGIDVILGYGSNYTQKITYKAFKQKSDDTEKNCLVLYDLGNLYADNSGLDTKKTVPTESLLVTIKLTLPPEGKTALMEDLSYTPVHISKAEKDQTNRAQFISILSEEYSNYDTKPDIFATNAQWTSCKNSFNRLKTRVTEWVGDKIKLSAPISEPTAETGSSAVARQDI